MDNPASAMRDVSKMAKQGALMPAENRLPQSAWVVGSDGFDEVSDVILLTPIGFRS
jgi:hypothetical protein